MIDDPAGGTRAGGDYLVLLESEGLLKDLDAGVQKVSEQLGAFGDVSAEDIAEAKTALASARRDILEEVRRHETAVRNAEGRGEAAPLDLDAVRFGIGRRLDRIRNARRAGGVSGEFDE